ncbi:hypothetical protein PINS_up012820 [Pythium insidiosum]|nr:hypothetical protein PINS_up012820 [Pythium insidiosum]
MDDERKHGFKAAAAVSASRASSSSCASSSSSSSLASASALSRHAEHSAEDHRLVLASVGMLPPTTNWSYSEHSRFMRALEVYGTDSTGDAWKRIAMFVRTRTIEEVRLHGRQYLQQLMRDQQRRHHRAQFESDARVRHESQNDPNGPNHAVASTSSDTQKAKRRSVAKVSVTGAAATAAAVGEHETSSVFAHSLSSAARSAAALEMKLRASPSRQGVKPYSGTVLATASSQQPRKSVRRSKEWTFDDDKALETTLASWPPGRAYSWPKIASSIPGKTAKDVRLRYEQLVEDVASIESADDTAARASYFRTGAPSSQSLSSRIAPPPPIQVPPPLVAATKAEKLALDSPSFGALRSRGGKSFASGMLSPTFFDFLGADDKSPADLPSPLLPSPIVGAPLAGSGTSSLSPCPTGPLLSPLGLDLGQNGRKTTTPRVWHDFLADDLKLDGKIAALRAPLEFGDTEEKRSSGDM